VPLSFLTLIVVSLLTKRRLAAVPTEAGSAPPGLESPRPRAVPEQPGLRESSRERPDVGAPKRSESPKSPSSNRE
jgi:hypothetical protein